MDITVGNIKGKQKHELIIRKQKELRIVSYYENSYGDCKGTRKSTLEKVHNI